MPEMTGQNELSAVKRALVEIRKLRARVDELEKGSAEPIAIVGLGLRLPGGATDEASFWDLLTEGRDVISEVPPDRWDWRSYNDEGRASAATRVTRFGGFLEHAQDFDAGFFGISPREAVMMDPQHRLVLEIAWEALENAGYAASVLQGTDAGVFIGIGNSDYGRHTMRESESIDAYVGSGNAPAMVAGRLSYVLGTHGPALAIDTSCSSSLVAVHEACVSLRAGECRMALAGGVNLMLLPEPHVALSRAQMMAPDGRCKVFDDAANGYVRSEGSCIVVLKKLSSAVQDRDRIVSVIRGSAVNHDGRSGGLTAPSGPAQMAVIRKAIDVARVQPSDIGFVETHGTGTSLGDPIEVEALASVLCEGRDPRQPLLLGAVKSNLGHLEAASGIVGLVKAALVLRHQIVPANLHIQKQNTRIPWGRLTVAVPRECTPWKGRYAGVSSFGFSGTNAHVILERPGESHAESKPPERSWHVLTISAKSDASLEKLRSQYAAVLRNQEVNIADFCFTANTGRSHFEKRLAIVGQTAEEFLARLDGSVTDRTFPGTADVEPGRICFLFTGQGSQYAGMGRELYESSGVYRSAVERCSEAWQEQTGESLIEAVYVRGEELKTARVIQPALFALEYGVAELWRSWGIEPSVVLGHSLGEYVGSVVSGLLTLSDGLGLVHARAELMDRLSSRSTMLAVSTDVERVSRSLEGLEAEVSIAAINGPESIVISGSVEGVRQAGEKLAAQGVRTRELEVSHGFHSPMLEPILDEFEARAGKVRYGTARQRIVSNLTGRVAEAGEMSRARYWRDHMRHTVQFHAGLQAALATGCTTFIEIGPQPHLISLAKTSASNLPVLWLPSMRRGRNAWPELVSAIKALYEDGAEIDWAAFYEKRGRRIALPGYPWEERSFPLPRRAETMPAIPSANSFHHPLLGVRLASPLKEIQFQSVISPSRPVWLADHALREKPLMPAAGYLEIALSAARASGLGEAAVEAVALLQPCVFDEPRILQCVVSKGDESATFEISSSAASDPGEWLLHATGALVSPSSAPSSELDSTSLASAQSRCLLQRSIADFYADFEQRGLTFGLGFQPLVSLQVGHGEAVASFKVPMKAQDEQDAFTIHPVALDACFQTVAAAVMSLEKGEAQVALPAGLNRLRITGDCSRLVNAHAVVKGGSEGIRAEFQGFDESGKLLIVGEGLIFRTGIPSTGNPDGAAVGDLIYEVDWVPVADAEPSRPAIGTEGQWLLFGTAQDVQPLAAMLRRNGNTNVTTGVPDEELTLAEAADTVTDIVYVAPSLSEANSDWRALKDFLPIAQAVSKAQSGAPARLWVITRSAQGPGLSNPDQATLWGMARSMALEHPEVRVIRVDFDESAGEQDWLRAFKAAQIEDEIAVRSEAVYASRIRRATHPAKRSTDAEDAQVELGIAERGTLENLQLISAERRPPAANEVEIEVRAAGLNFRDVLNALGMYKGKPGPLGGECAGIVRAVGADVSNVKPGDEVVAVGSGCFRRYMNTASELVWHKPEQISFSAAAALPIAFLTASYALHDVARIQPGESILIHAGAGGVGQAAIQIARAAGAVVFATAGSDEKRAYLRAMGVGLVMDSRSLDFSSEVLKATDGRGVDIVLNSLAGPFIDAGFAALAQRGRFLELGVADLRSDEWVQKTRPDVGYFQIDLIDRNQIVSRVLTEIFEKIRSGSLEPLPNTLFEMEKAQDAFRWMAQARHIGKITLAFARKQSESAIRNDGAYLVTGGISGLGLEVAKWLSEQRAGEVVVLGRSAPSEATCEVFDAMRNSGTAVTVCQGDVSVVSDVASAISTRLPLRGVFHCAGTLQDAALSRQNWVRFKEVLAGKAEGARHLHQLTQDHPLDHFVLFSSIAAVLGSPGQTNYAAANAYLDALARQRSMRNLPALSVNWGAWQEVGMAVRHGTLDRAAASGMTGMTTRDGLLKMSELMQSAAGPQAMVLAMDWNRYAQTPLAAKQRPLLSEIETRDARKAPAPVATRAKAESWLPKLQAAGKLQEREVLQSLLDERIRSILRLPREQAIHTEQPLQELGLDSLLSIELRNSVGISLHRSLPATLLFDYPMLRALTDYLLSIVGASEPARPKQSRAKPDRRSALDDIEALSDDEVNELLNRQTRTRQEV